jgi:hypothetical protein
VISRALPVRIRQLLANALAIEPDEAIGGRRFLYVLLAILRKILSEQV